MARTEDKVQVNPDLEDLLGIDDVENTASEGPQAREGGVSITLRPHGGLKDGVQLTTNVMVGTSSEGEKYLYGYIAYPVRNSQGIVREMSIPWIANPRPEDVDYFTGNRGPFELERAVVWAGSENVGHMGYADVYKALRGWADNDKPFGSEVVETLQQFWGKNVDTEGKVSLRPKKSAELGTDAQSSTRLNFLSIIESWNRDGSPKTKVLGFSSRKDEADGSAVQAAPTEL